MPILDHQEALKKIVEADGDFSAALQQVLGSFFRTVGGPAAFGEILGQWVMDDSVPVTNRIQLANNMVKFADQCGTAAANNEAISDEELSIVERALREGAA